MIFLRNCDKINEITKECEMPVWCSAEDKYDEQIEISRNTIKTWFELLGVKLYLSNNLLDMANGYSVNDL